MKTAIEHYRSRNKQTESSQQPADENLTHGDLPKILQRMHEYLCAQYGSQFSTRVNTPEKLDAWRQMWTDAIDGKNPDHVVVAFKQCLKAHPVPFTTGHFMDAYASITAPSLRRYEHRALPNPLRREESKRIAAKAFAQMRSIKVL